MRMGKSDASYSESLRKLIHDLNGELFLIRGYADIALKLVKDNQVAVNNLNKLLERAEEMETILGRLRQKQRELDSQG